MDTGTTRLIAKEVEVLDPYMLMAVLGKPLAGTLAEVREGIEMLEASEDAFVETILGRIPPTPPNHHRIVESNEAGLLPGGDPTDLEAGANRYAVS